MYKPSAILDLSLTSLSADDRDAYAAIIDNILTQYDEEPISSDEILEMLRERTSLALTRQRHHIKLLIIERVRMQPTPQTVVSPRTECVNTAPKVNDMAAAVFNVPELLESILYYIPMVDLIRSRRVNKALHRLIETSPKLQRKLFLLPSNDPPMHYGWIYHTEVDKMLAWLGTPLPPGISPRSPKVIAVLNPLLVANDWDFDCSPDETHSLAVVHSTKIDKRILNCNTWPEMYLTSPPCTNVQISIVYIAEADGHGYSRLIVHRNVCDLAGVTFATVQKVLHEEGSVIVGGDCEVAPQGRWNYQEVEGTTVREQIDYHRRRGIKLVLDAEESGIRSYSVTIPASSDGIPLI